MWLGAAGLIPFVSCAAGVAAGGIDLSLPLGVSMTPDQLVHLQAVYGASILSFMGAVHWGLAMAGYRRPMLRETSVTPKEPQDHAESQSNGEVWRYGLRYMCACALRACVRVSHPVCARAVWCRV
jgi:hypothetical protein